DHRRARRAGTRAGHPLRCRPAGPLGTGRRPARAPARADERLCEVNKKLTAAVQATGTTLTEMFGAGPVIAATVIGEVADVSGSPAGTASPPTTAPPIEVSPGNRKVSASITSMIRHYVARRAQVAEGHPHNAE